MCDWPHGIPSAATRPTPSAEPPVAGEPRLGRRAVLLGAAAASMTVASAAAVATRRPATARAETPPPAPVPVAAGLEILPRDAWGADLPPGPLRPETPRFLLVHHTASPNNYRDVREVLRGGFRFQTGPAKGWPDVCYQFFIGRDGDVWEGRAGSLAGPVTADATGGSQGWAQLVCLIGDFTTTAPRPAAIDSLVLLLEWIARRDGIDVSDDATATFVSRGSQRWAAGTTVTTPTIAAHRDMSYTLCPGAPVVAMLPEIRRRVAEVHRRYTTPAARAPHPDGLAPARRRGAARDV